MRPRRVGEPAGRTWLDEQVAEIRQRLMPADEGALWLMLFEDLDRAPLTATAIEGAMAHIDPVMARNLALIIEGVPARATLLVVPRRDGTPHSVDRRLWRSLQHLVNDGRMQLLDLVVVGDRCHWSAAEDRECGS